MKIAELTMAGLCLWAGTTEAETATPYEPEFHHYQQPVPSRGSRWFPSGSVRITFDVESSGAMTHLVVEHATHPELAEAVRTATRSWRFKPWNPSTNAPPLISDMRNIFFSKTWHRIDVSTYERARLSALSCKVFNAGQLYGQTRLSSDEIFAWQADDLLAALIYEAATRQRIAYYESVRLFDLFERAIPDIKRRCLDNPERSYLEIVPGPVLQAIGMAFAKHADNDQTRGRE